MIDNTTHESASTTRPHRLGPVMGALDRVADGLSHAAGLVRRVARREELERMSRLEMARLVMLAQLAIHAPSAGRRDLRLMTTLVGRPDARTMHELRFEYFDLLCHHEGEQMALRKLQRVDMLLSPRRRRSQWVFWTR